MISQLFAFTILITGMAVIMALAVAYRHFKKKYKERTYRRFWTNTIKIK